MKRRPRTGEPRTRRRKKSRAEALTLEVDIQTRSTCERHVVATVPREDIDRYFDKEFTELMPTAHVPGFRPGRAPRKLVETRFRKDVAEKVKSELLMDSLDAGQRGAEAVGDQRAGFRPRGGRAARRGADDVRVRPRSAARVRAAASGRG